MNENNTKKRGRFVVIYGNNNIGKSTQAKMLVERMKAEGESVRYIKYPIYNLAPTGPLINAYLREGNPYGLSPREAQTLYAMNRTQFEPQLTQWLKSGETVVAEDYTGTSLGWGQGAGVDKEYLLEVNSHLLEPDQTLFLDGERFLEGKEHKHIHEQNDDLINRVGKIFQDLAKEFNWTTVDAVGSVEEVHERMWKASGL